MHQRTCATIGLLLTLLALPLHADLTEYVARPDGSFHYEIKDAQQVGSLKVYIVQLTSQTWKGIPWTHWLRIVVPTTLAHPDTAVLLVQGGVQEETTPRVDSRSTRASIIAAADGGFVAVELGQVPNQPLFDDLREDALIAYTLSKSLEQKDDDWPVLLPMVKSVVRAMDAVQAVVKEQASRDIKDFILTGASKRGWTTWLTAAVDARILAIAPSVYDMLHMDAQVAHQAQSYGRFSDKIHDYTERSLPRLLMTEPGRRLGAMIDPWQFRQRLTMPKLILLGTNDPYWTVDSARL
ncbi:MAG: hypothetical protein IT440_06635 [Phycisphaeraceae bacterium]|nr:hypothetical protein [Phycisphaeraceae bacterium]